MRIAQAAAEADTNAEAWPEAQAALEADIDPEALTVMASVEADFAAIDDNLARAQAGIAERHEQRSQERAEREQAAVDEPAVYADVQAGLQTIQSSSAARPYSLRRILYPRELR